MDISLSPLKVIICVLVGMVFYWCATHLEDPTPSALPAESASPTPKPTPSRRYAPQGTFFILQYVSEQTPKGTIGFEPGRQVQFVKAFPERETLLVTDGQYQLEVRPRFLTNDLDIADLTRRRDEAAQAQIAAYQQRELQAFQALRQKLELEHADHVSAAEADRIRASAIGGWKSRLGPNSPYSYFYN